MKFGHAAEVWAEFPQLVPGVVITELRTTSAPVNADLLDEWIAPFWARARDRLALGPESALPEIQAWRRAFGQLGLKPTQYRCASESLLRRFRKEDSLPPQHPLVDLGNAVSLAYAIPVAVLDLARISGDLTVRPATGAEDYLTFGGDHEHPHPGEIVFADSDAQAHSRRWTHRQSRLSAVSDDTAQVLIVAEGLHEKAGDDVARLVDDLRTGVEQLWAPVRTTAVLTRESPTVGDD